MSNLIRFSSDWRTKRAEQHKNGLSGGTLVVYDAGSGVPASADTALTDQTALVTFTIPDPAGTVTDGILTGAAIASALIAESGTAAFARAYDDADGVIGDYDVGGTGSGAAILLDNLTFVQGAYASVVSFVIEEG